MAKVKLKSVLPSLREKKRYLVFEVISKEKISNFSLVYGTIINCSLQFLGRFGVAKAGIIPLENKWNPKLQRGIIKIGHKQVDNVKSALMFANKIDNQDVIIRSLGVSGILKKAEKRYIK